MRIHQSLPQAKYGLYKPAISICKDVAYSNRRRTVMDIYIPSQQAAHSQPSHPESSWQNRPDTDSANMSIRGSAAAHSKTSDSSQEPFPVALFCHGGVWATGALNARLCLAHCLGASATHETHTNTHLSAYI